MIRLIICVIFEVVLLLLCVPLGFFEIFLPKKIDIDLKKKKIIILHGWLNRNLIYYLLKYRLQKIGYSVITPDLGWHARDLEKITQQLEKFISDHSLQDFVLLGHSMGGIIALNYYKKNHSKVDKLVAMASPFGGTFWAIIFYIFYFSKATKQVIPGNKFLKNLLSDIDFSRKNIFCLFTRYDEIVPSQSAQLPFAKNIEVNIIGHMSFIYSKTVIKSLEEIL